MCRLSLLILLFFVSMPAFAERTIVTRTPYYNHHYPQAYYGGDYIPHRKYMPKNSSVFYDINDLEKYALNRNFTKDSDRARLERLETLTFGAIQEGDIYKRYDNVRSSILSRPKQNYKTSILQNISNYFNGQLTGFTPQINNSYSPDIYSYPSSYDRNSYTEHRSPWGSGYRMNNYGLSNGSGVHILD